VFNSKRKPKSKIAANILSAIILASSIPAITVSSAASAGTCRLSVDTSSYNDAIDRYCDTQADVTTPDFTAERGDPGWIPYFFENPDECDLGISFPDLIPDFNFDLSKINSCEILKAVSSNAVDQVNQKFSEIEGDVRETTGGDIDIDIDIGDEVDDRVNDDL
jgi:hypothetical protein